MQPARTDSSPPYTHRDIITNTLPPLAHTLLRILSSHAPGEDSHYFSVCTETFGRYTHTHAPSTNLHGVHDRPRNKLPVFTEETTLAASAATPQLPIFTVSIAARTMPTLSSHTLRMRTPIHTISRTITRTTSSVCTETCRLTSRRRRRRRQGLHHTHRYGPCTYM
jgi:hypothetical protein